MDVSAAKIISVPSTNPTSALDSRRRAESAVERLTQMVQNDLAAVNTAILDKMQSSVPLIPQLAGHLIASGGKRLRPMLTLASAQMLGADRARAVQLSACVEFIHTATLLHDDVVDESALRRGTETANEIWGNQASVLVGDFLFSRSFELMVEDGSLQVLKILSGASSIIAEGEVLQLATAGDLSTGESRYLEVIAAKTAALFAAACEISAVIADAGDAAAKALSTYGEALGIAFQIVDDVLDYSAKQAELGKSIGDDFREGKITLPVILAYRDASQQEKTFWDRTIAHQKHSDGDLPQALAYMEKHDALARSMEQARRYGDKAIEALSIFPDTPARRALEDIVFFCLARGH